ncbi:copper chaperone PCu(A)C [Micromonospora sp. NPDC050417]|uniref:copper chaperone PCu(A)C n=1 Tax=Micromonospora sp. NPDC050417 TaxID=3364280 RepID=UPI0037A793E8
MIGALVVGALALGTAAGCGASDPSPSRSSPEAHPSTAVTSVFHVRDPWVKAAQSGMTAAFGVLVNDSGSDATIVSATSSVSPMELHEMTMKDGKMVMRPKADGITVKARSTHTLEPSGDHLMLMELAKPVQPGDEVTFTLTFADGRTAEFTAIAKPFAGAGESYDPQSGTAPSAGPAT